MRIRARSVPTITSTPTQSLLKHDVLPLASPTSLVCVSRLRLRLYKLGVPSTPQDQQSSSVTCDSTVRCINVNNKGSHPLLISSTSSFDSSSNLIAPSVECEFRVRAGCLCPNHPHIVWKMCLHDARASVVRPNRQKMASASTGDVHRLK